MMSTKPISSLVSWTCFPTKFYDKFKASTSYLMHPFSLKFNNLSGIKWSIIIYMYVLGNINTNLGVKADRLIHIFSI